MTEPEERWFPLSEEPEFLGTDLDSEAVRSGLPEWLLGVCFVVAVGLVAFLLVSGSDDEAVAPTTTVDPVAVPEISTTTPQSPSPMFPESLERRVEPLVAPVGQAIATVDGMGYLVLRPDTGHLVSVETEVPLTSLAAAGRGSLYLFRADGAVERVRLGNSTGTIVVTGVANFLPVVDGNGVWISNVDEPFDYVHLDADGEVVDRVERTTKALFDPRYRFEPGGGTYRLGDGDTEFVGPHLLINVGPDVLVGRTCDADARCRLESWTPDAGWNPVAFPIFRLRAVEGKIDPTGRFAIFSDADGPSLHMVTIGEDGFFSVGRSTIRPEFDYLYSTDGEELIVITNDRVRVIDTASKAEESVVLPAGTTLESHRWVAVDLTSATRAE